MAPSPIFDRTEPHLLPTLDELRRLEPIFHTAGFGLTAEKRAARMAEDYWEIGASGQRYCRDFILTEIDPTHFIDAQEAGWRAHDHALRQLGPDTYLITYTLDQASRLTRRSTIWHRNPHGWQILYHQGTIIGNAPNRD